MSCHNALSQPDSVTGQMEISEYVNVVCFVRVSFECTADASMPEGYYEKHKTSVMQYFREKCYPVLIVQEGDVSRNLDPVQDEEERFIVEKDEKYERIAKLHYHVVVEVDKENTLRQYLSRTFVDQNGNKQGNKRWSCSIVRKLPSVLKYSCKGASVDHAPKILFIAGHLDGSKLHQEWWEVQNRIQESRTKSGKKKLSRSILEECYEKVNHNSLDQGVIACDVYRFYVNKRIRIPIFPRFSEMVNTYISWNNESSETPLSDKEALRRIFPRFDI